MKTTGQKKFFQKPENPLLNCPLTVREINLSETEVQEMQKDVHENAAGRVEVSPEELGDVLIAISVVAKRLAERIYDKDVGGEKECQEIMD